MIEYTVTRRFSVGSHKIHEGDLIKYTPREENPIREAYWLFFRAGCHFLTVLDHISIAAQIRQALKEGFFREKSPYTTWDHLFTDEL